MSVIYIASPYTIGDVAANVSTQIDAAHRIMDMGHAPIAPLLSHYLHIYRQRPYEEWLKADLMLVGKADVVIRLPGESKGADLEASHAEELEVPVAYSWEQLEWILDSIAENPKPAIPNVTLDGGVTIPQESIPDAMFKAMDIISTIGTTDADSKCRQAKQWMREYYPNWDS